MVVVRARVRGIYATALSKLLYDNGIELVDVSEVIAERLGIDTNRGLPADVTIKTDDSDLSQILILGFPEAVNSVLNIIEGNIPSLIIYKPKIGLYSAFKARVVGLENNECIAETPIGKAVLVDVNECKSGLEVPVSAVKIPVKPNEKLVISGRIRVVGKYAIVSYGSGVSFSSFIRNKDRITELLSVSTKYLRDGYSIRWRSNADEAPLNEIINEVPGLIKKLDELRDALESARPFDIVYEGEYVRLIEFTYNSKLYLDSIRSKVATTTPYHHILRSCDITVSSVADLLDSIAQYVSHDKLANAIKSWIIKKLWEKKEVTLHHKRPTGKTIILGKGSIDEATIDDNGNIELIVRRHARSKGIYDGLRVPKEVGDIILTTIVEGKWYLIHKYLRSDEEIKGIYININTPPEISPTGSVVYVDLGVDIVRDGEGCSLVDSEKFRALIENDLITPDIIANTLRTIESALNMFCT